MALGPVEVAVRWILNDLDPTDWRGEAVVFLPDAVARDHVFRGVKGLTARASKDVSRSM